MNNHQFFEALKKILPNAYAPYSNFHVAAIIETELGYFAGFNIENASYPLTICGERTALFSSMIAGAKKVLAIHLLTSNENGNANMCGACRQTLIEHANEETKVFVYAHDGSFQEFYLHDLLPNTFLPKYL